MVTDAVNQIKLLEPDVVFLDIEMPQQNGFTLFKYFNDINFNVVFVTAYNNFAIKAFRVSAVDYLLKPIDIERLLEAEKKIVKHQRFNQNFEVLQQNLKTAELKTIAIPYKNDFAIVKINDIMCIQASRVYSNLIVYNTEKKIEKVYTYSKTLGYFEETLPNNQFVRVHRSWIINFNYIKFYSKKENTITLENKQQIPVSKTYKEALENLFL